MSKQKKFERETNESKSVYETAQFKELQMKWYRKLDSKGFNDIERTGKNRQVYFDEYSGILDKPLSVLKRKINSFALAHYNILRKFSHYKGVLPILQPKSEKNRAKNGETDSKALNITQKTSKQPNTATKLTPSDCSILQLTGNGATIAQVSAHLRRYHAHHVDSSHKTGPKGKPYSTYYVHTRLQQLVQLAAEWNRLGQPD